MGHVTHNAIIVTSWDGEKIAAARTRAVEFGLAVSAPLVSNVNRYHSILVGPDGSKSGWPDDDVGDAKRNGFVVWLTEQRYEDGSSSFEWVEVRYGNDDANGHGVMPKVVRHEWKKPRKPAPLPRTDSKQ